MANKDYLVDFRAKAFRMWSGEVRVFEPYGEITEHGDLGFKAEEAALKNKDEDETEADSDLKK